MNYNDLDPGIRETVRWLRIHGFETSDSGDGVSKEGMDCTMPFPHVYITCAPDDLVDVCRALVDELDMAGVIVMPQGGASPSVQGMYDPCGGVHGAGILLMGLDDGMWP